MRLIRLKFGANLLQAGERLEDNVWIVARCQLCRTRWCKRLFECELSRGSVGGQVDAGSSSRQNRCEVATDRRCGDGDGAMVCVVFSKVYRL